MTNHDLIKKNRSNRLEDSFLFPENQTKRTAEEEYVFDHEKMQIEKLHEKNLSEECKRILGKECVS
jgi:hypothetical protein